jgi:hypothetical protein
MERTGRTAMFGRFFLPKGRTVAPLALPSPFAEEKNLDSRSKKD